MRGFGAGIRTRLQAARQEYADDLHHNAQSGDQAATGKELLLADRPQQVLAEFQRLFPDLRPVRTPRRFDHDAYEKGKRAGRDADLGTGHLDGSDHQELT
jgi:hypothetical protein